MRKRIINFRPIVLIALAIVAGILIGYARLYGAFWAFWVIFGLTLGAGVVFFIFKFRKVALCFLIALLAFLSGFFNFNLSYSSFCVKEYRDEEVFVSGKLTDYYSESKNSIFISVKEVSINYEKTDFNVGAWIYLDQDVSAEEVKQKIGCYVDFNCRLNNAPIFTDGINTFYVKQNIAFLATSVSDLSWYNGSLSFDETAREFVRNTLKSNMTEDTAAVGIALLLGDKSNMSAELKNGYRQMGISHIFAVSGLHIGFIYTVLNFIVFKTRMRKWKAIPIVFLPMLFYAWVCGFSPSVVRALVMTTCVVVFNALGTKNDSLSSLATAATIILSLHPLYLFDAGFLMSFSAVFGIICISRILNRYVFTENKLLKSVYSVVFISFGATLGTIGLIVEFYGEIAWLGMVFNLLITPFISIVFIVLLVGLIPFLKFLLVVPQGFFTLTNYIASGFSESGLGALTAKSFGIALLFIYAAMFVFGGFINLSPKVKKLTVLSLSTVAAIIAVIVALPKTTKQRVRVISSNEEYCYVVTDSLNNAFVISDFSSEYDTDEIIDCCKADCIKNVYVFVLNPESFDCDIFLALKESGLSIGGVYFNGGNVYNTTVDKIQGNDIDTYCFVNGNSVSVGEYDFTCIYDGGKAWFLNGDRVTMLFCEGVNNTAFDRIKSNVTTKIDLVFVSDNEEYVLVSANCLAVVTQNYSSTKILGAKTLGNFTIDIKHDKITVIP